MTAEVVSLNRNGEILPDIKTSPVLIEWLEDQLERAKAGEVIGFAGAMLEKDRTGSFFIVGQAGGFSMLGAMDCARHKLIDIAAGDE